MGGENQPDTVPQETDDSPRKERHDFLASVLKESRSELVDFMFKQGAVLTLILGWILSSKEAHDFIQTHPCIRFIGIPSTCMYFVLLVYWIWSYKERSDSAYLHLLNLRYMPGEFYSSLRVTNAVAVSLISAHFILCAVLTAALLQTK